MQHAILAVSKGLDVKTIFENKDERFTYAGARFRGSVVARYFPLAFLSLPCKKWSVGRSSQADTMVDRIY